MSGQLRVRADRNRSPTARAARSAPDPLVFPDFGSCRHGRLGTSSARCNKRVHILEGFEKVFSALDEILRIIRKSEGKADAASQIMKRFDLDPEQADAILELKIYRLARLEILVITSELADKRKRARQISGLLRNEQDRLERRAARAGAHPEGVRRPEEDQASTGAGLMPNEIEYSADDSSSTKTTS